MTQIEMNLFQTADDLRKTIRQNPHIEQIKSIVLKLKSSSRGLGNKIYPSPFIGMLLLDQEKIKAFFKKSPIEEFNEWEETDKKLLFDIHKQMYLFNEMCIEPLKKEFPHTSYSVNPYLGLNEIFGYYGDIEFPTLSDKFDEILFSKDEAMKIVSLFHKHPAFEVIFSNLSEIKNNGLQIHTNQAVLDVEKKLMNLGTRKHLYEDREERKNKDIFTRYILALVCLRDSLSNINQIIYQGVLQENLASLTRDDVIDYTMSWTDSGAGIALMYLIRNADLFCMEPTDLIILNLENNGLENKLCRVEVQHTSFSFGKPVYIDCRLIDNNMNSYYGLLRQP